MFAPGSHGQACAPVEMVTQVATGAYNAGSEAAGL